jgi:hypothetical protein
MSIEDMQVAIEEGALARYRRAIGTQTPTDGEP